MNRTSALIIAIAAAALLAIGNAQTQAPKTPGPVGRYQLFTGETSAGSGEGHPSHKAILRIDTETGTVDEWVTNAAGDSWYRTGNIRGTAK